jgi:probable rRNA maturation factor
VIAVRNLNKKHRVNERCVASIARRTLKVLNRPSATDLDIVFLSDRDIRPINKRYKHRDRATDVLSFELGTCGQIIISSDTALKNSARFGTSFAEELALYVIHGILHLFGYDDGTKTEKKKMSGKERHVLNKICQKSFSKVLMPR